MEATGVYWKPVWHLLEGRFELVLANAQHIRNVPGRKTDVNDATWIANLLAHGLIRSSFVPPAPIQELRDLTRTRKQLTREMGQHTLRIQKVLEDEHRSAASSRTSWEERPGHARGDHRERQDPSGWALAAARTAQAPALVALRGRATGHHRALLSSTDSSPRSRPPSRG
jgi:transposase